MKNRTSDLERLLTETKSEIGELRARKDKGPLEQLKEVAALKEALSALGGEAEAPSTAAQIFEAVANSPLGQGLAARIQGPPQGLPQMVANGHTN